MSDDATTGIWDIHHHWVNEAGYVDRLLRQMDRLGIERVGLIGMGESFPDLFVRHERSDDLADNVAVAALAQARGERFWAYGYLQPGRCEPADVDRLAEMGVAGLKFHMPIKPYGEPEYFELYARAQQHHLPCLFHTGVMQAPAPTPGRGVRSENYRPIHLEPIAWEFPDLVLIAAHLGVCWNEEAATLCRMCPNVYADLSGSAEGWRASKSAEWFRQILFWPAAHRKVFFGSDVHADELEGLVDHDRRLFEQMGWTAERRACVFRDNARRVFGHDEDR